MQPLSHHEILGLVEPFTRSGRAVDLAASDRASRRLAFKPMQRAEAGLPPLLETLALENPETGQYRLTRTLALADGLAATLLAEGAQPAALLAQVDAVPPQRQFDIAPGHRLALGQQLDAAGRALALLAARARIDGFDLGLAMPTVRGVPAEITLTAAGEPNALPEDLLAVLGWDWTRLEARADGWRGHLRLRGRGIGRSVHAERRLRRAVDHLARTLAEPPGRFHDRHRLARWGVVLRRAVPLLVSLGLIAAAAAVPRLALADDSVMRMLILNAPPLLLIGFFCVREIPRIEIPPLPRRSTAAGWFTARNPSPIATEADSACSATR